MTRDETEEDREPLTYAGLAAALAAGDGVDIDPRWDPGQVARWAAGGAGHGEDGGCCPDFGCCRPALLQPPEVRAAFAGAGGRDRVALFGRFLAAAVTLMAGEAGAEADIVIRGGGGAS